MSSHDDRLATTTRESITVQKYRPEERPDIAMARLRITGPDTPCLVRVVEEIPDQVPEVDVGFDPDRCDDWRFENGRVWFTAVVDGDPVETTYGVKGADSRSLAGRPRIDLVVPLDDTPSTPVLGD